MTDRIVLFIGVGNAVSARISEALFNQDPPVGWKGRIAAVAPASSADLGTAWLLQQLGVDRLDLAPERLTRPLTERADVRVTLGARDHPQCPSYLRSFPQIEWRLAEPARLDEHDFRIISGQLRVLVSQLKGRLAPARLDRGAGSPELFA